MRFPLVRPFAVAASLALAAGAQAQETIELKLAYFVGDQHAMSQWLIKWSGELEKGSNGRIVVKRFPGAQMGPTPQHYDFARTGQADVAWFLHGGTPGRFPLDRDHQPAVHGRQLRDRHQDAERPGAAGEVPRRRAQGREGADAAHAPAGRSAHDQEGDPHDGRLQGPAPALRLAADPRPGAGARRDAGGRAADRDRRAAAEGDDRRRVHRLRRRRDRVQARRHDQVLDRALRLRRELRRGDERGVLEQAPARSEEARRRPP